VVCPVVAFVRRTDFAQNLRRFLLVTSDNRLDLSDAFSIHLKQLNDAFISAAITGIAARERDGFHHFFSGEVVNGNLSRRVTA
jgi:hypothetical protein